MLDADTFRARGADDCESGKSLDVLKFEVFRERRDDTPALVKMDLTGCSGAFIMLSNGQEYQVDGPVVGLPDMFWVRRSGASGTIMLSQSAAPTPMVIYDDVHFGQLHWYLTFHDEALGVAVYADRLRSGLSPSL